MKCPTGSYKENGVCLPIHRCPNGSHRTCVSQLKENKERVELRSRDNELLKDVITDYEKILEHVKRQKEQQEQQLSTILGHLQQLRENHFLSRTGLLHVQHEQEQLLSKYQRIRQAIHSILRE